MKPEPEHTRAFATEAAFEKWLAKHHDRAPHIWIRYFKKASGKATITYQQALDVSLCWGWIDGQGSALDDVSYAQRFSPRRPKSLWSQRNRDHVARLTAAGRMQPTGQAHVDAAKANGRWEAAYAGQSKMETPPELLAAITANQRAHATYATLDKQNLFAMAFRYGALRTAAGRAKKLAAFVAMLARGETLFPIKAKVPSKAGKAVKAKQA